MTSFLLFFCLLVISIPSDLFSSNNRGILPLWTLTIWQAPRNVVRSLLQWFLWSVSMITILRNHDNDMTQLDLIDVKWHYTALQKKNLKYTIDECHHFLCICGHWIRIWNQLCPITSRFCCMRGDYFWKTIENEKITFQKQCLVDIFLIVTNVF